MWIKILPRELSVVCCVDLEEMKGSLLNWGSNGGRLPQQAVETKGRENWALLGAERGEGREREIKAQNLAGTGHLQPVYYTKGGSEKSPLSCKQNSNVHLPRSLRDCPPV